MGMTWADHGGGDFEQAPPGTHIARCVSLIDLGTQESEYGGKQRFVRKNMISWELPNAIQNEGNFAGQPFRVSKFYTASLSAKANLRTDLMNWRGRDFSDAELQGFVAKTILGTPCMLALTPDAKNKIRITGVFKAPAGSQVPPQINPSLYFSLEEDEFNMAIFESLSDGLKKIIAASPEYKEVTDPKTMVNNAQTARKGNFEELDDDIPF